MSHIPRLLSAICVISLAASPILAAGYGTSGGATAAATSGPTDPMMHDMAMGSARKMTTPDGMSLYVFAKDTPGQSNCSGACATEWPPMLASSGATVPGDFSIITRPDGSKQWAYMGRPLYMFDEDKVAGDINGADYSADWHLATVAQ